MANLASTALDHPDPATLLEREKLALDRLRFKSEMVKWIAIAAGAVVSFAVIDYGKLQLERFRANAENHRELLKSYLDATDAAEPEVWTRKLKIILKISEDPQLREWATGELDYIRTSAARDALYREALKVASQLVEPSQLGDPNRKALRARFNQLYWADLPFAGESIEVSGAMVQFRNKLMAAEAAGADDRATWTATNTALIELAKILKGSVAAQ